MNNAPLDPNERSLPAKPGNVFGIVIIVLFATPFAGFGLAALVQGARKAMVGDMKDGLMLCLFGLIFSTIGFGVMAAALWARKRANQKAALRAQFPDQPWMLRGDWASGRIKSKFGAPVGFFLSWSILALALSAPAVWNLPGEWQKGNHAILVALIFPIVAFWLLGYSLFLWLSRRRFGQCFFELAQVPIRLGGKLEGMIQVGARLKLEHGLHLKFSCVRRAVSGSGKNRSISESVLWQDEKVFRPDASLPEPEPGHSGIPIYFKLPDGQPQCFTRGDVSVIWRLEVRAKMRGPDFMAAFEVPVFHVDGAAAAPADGPDPTASLQMPMDEIRRDEHSRIKVSDGPGGREFYFPPARNIGAALFTSLLALIFDAGSGWAFYSHVMIVFPLFLGLFGLLFSCFAFGLWFKASRIIIASTGVRVVTRHLVFSRMRQFSAAAVIRFESGTGMTSGSHVFADIRLVQQDGDTFAANVERYRRTGLRPPLKFRISNPRGIVVASAIPSALEANWLTQQMNRALGRQV